MDKIINSIESWKKSLLDTSKRNRAINFKKLQNSTIDVAYPKFEDFLNIIEKNELKFINLFDSLDHEKNKYEDKTYVISNGLSIVKKDEYNKDEMEILINNFLMKNKSRNVAFSSSYNHLQRKKLSSISNQARIFAEENALNVLYIAVGFLEWYEREDSNVKYMSPLLFLPARIWNNSINDPYNLKLLENDIIINDSLIRFMFDNFKYDFRYEFDLEKSILENYRNYKEFILNKISNSGKWKIHDEIHISNFKFNSINMVKDLEENAEQIINHNLIRQLVGDETEQSESESPFLTAIEVDERQQPNDFYQALDCDSSQSVAVAAALSGKSFVLQGPPGTGKSQTITNIITELIARDKKVLFVAEKKAALDVVYSNLEKINLHDYALTLHNTRFDKKQIISDLALSLSDRQGIYETISEESKTILQNEYISTKRLLNNYGNSLLKIRKPLNKNIYDLYGLFFDLNKYDEIRFDIHNVEKIDQQQLDYLRSKIIDFEGIMMDFDGKIKENPWYNLRMNTISYKEIEEIDEILEVLTTKNYEYKNTISNISTILNVNFTDYSLNSILNVINLIEKTKNIIDGNYEIEKYYFCNEQKLKTDYNYYTKILNDRKEIISLNNKIDNYDLEVLDLNVSNYHRLVASKNNFLKRIFSKDYRKIKNEIKLYQKNKLTKYNILISDLDNLRKYKYLLENISKNEKLIENKLFSNYPIESLSNLLILFENYIEYFELYNQILINGDKNNFLNTIRNNPNIYDEIEKLNEISKDIFKEITKLDEYLYNSNKFLDENIFGFSSNVDALLKNKMYVAKIAKFNSLKNEFYSNNLSTFFDYVVDNKLFNNLFEIYLRRHYFILINYYLETDETLSNFDSNKYLQIKEKFKAVENKLITTTSLIIRDKLNKNTPNLYGIEANNHEIQILRRESNKKRGIMPIRKLFDEIPNLILKLKPILMMSPLAVSTFLRTSDYKFDVVIFDEASQVFPYNAIGALYRADQFIIVGDSKQLPPTSFFRSIETDDDMLDTDVSDFESILDIVSASFPEISLKWHYRSKFEELITPSNREIYGNSLITFPQPLAANKREGLEFEKVNGIYYSGVNYQEAERVVDLIFEHFNQFGHERSLGVVTFNTKQTEEIENILEKRRIEMPEYEEYFSYADKEEPFFIKNLENVQGDERDTMILSVTYGPDKYGKISMNFGPINKKGGNRRLNVAITRAKYNLIVVSSMTHHDIDLSRVSNEGPRFLKQILKYAQYGFDEKVDEIDLYANFDSSFEEEVYREIIKLGYKANPQVGSSGYKIDLGVLHPQNENKYILGVECDGASYHSSAIARERDRLRQQVLENRGWKIYRIWSTDWFKNKEIEVKKLKEAIEDSLNNTNNLNEYTESLIDIDLELTTKIEESLFNHYPSYDDFNHLKNSTSIIDIVDIILDRTTPIHFDEIKKFIPYFYNRQMFTTKVASEFKQHLSSPRLKEKYVIKGKYILKYDQKFEFRRVRNHKNSRQFINIHKEELIHGIVTIVKKVGRISKKDLLDTIREYSGYQSSSANMRSYFNEIVDELENKNVLYIDDNEIIQL